MAAYTQTFEFPVMVVIHARPRNPSRHELVLMDKQATYAAACENIKGALNESPNNVEFMAKYGKPLGAVKRLLVRWANRKNDRGWPETTVVTEKNWTAVLGMLEKGYGEDSLEIEFE